MWSFLGRNRRRLWNAWGSSFGDFFQYTRYRMGFSTHFDPSCASNKLLCSLSAGNSTATNLTQPGPLPDLSRSPAFHCVTQFQPSCSQRYQLQCSIVGLLSIHAIYRRILCCRSHCTAAEPPSLLLPIHHIARPFTAPAPTVTALQLRHPPLLCECSLQVRFEKFFCPCPPVTRT